MTQEDKDLLLQDLCARLPYGVMVKAQYKDGEGWKIDDRKLLGFYTNGQVYLDCIYANIENIKPYLHPMSSMTEEEKEEIKPLFSKFTDEFGKRVLVVRQNKMALYQDWLNAHHFDYSGLIDKGLALEAPEGMYNIKQK